jgi:CHAD domain-containing protein
MHVVMVTTTRETERKYEGPPVDASRLGELDGVAGVRGPDHRGLEAVYFDTPDLRLARARITLRRRTGGPDAGWHAKLPAGPDSRDELRLPLGRGRADRVPAELADLVLAHTGGRPLKPVVRLRTDRTAWLLLDEQDRALVEVVDDEVHSQLLGDSVTADAWHEVEVELVDGAPGLLDTVGSALAAQGLAPSRSRSKLARALGQRYPAGLRSPVSRRSDAGTAVTGYLRTHLDAWRTADVLVRRDDPEGVHDLRVAARRIRAALKVHRQLFRADVAEPLVEELKWLTDLLGRTRDVEVITQELDVAVHALPPELVLGPVTAEITRHYAHDEAAQREQVLAALRGKRYLALLSAVDGLVADPPLTGRAAAAATEVLPGATRKAYRRAVRAARTARDTPAGPARDLALHDARRTAKRARYAAEVAEPVFGAKAKTFRKRLKDAVGELGVQHDTVLVRAALRELAIAAHGSGGNAFTFGLLYGRAEAASADRERRFFREWRRITRKKSTHWLRRT